MQQKTAHLVLKYSHATKRTQTTLRQKNTDVLLGFGLPFPW